MQRASDSARSGGRARSVRPPRTSIARRLLHRGTPPTRAPHLQGTTHDCDCETSRHPRPWTPTWAQRTCPLPLACAPPPAGQGIWRASPLLGPANVSATSRPTPPGRTTPARATGPVCLFLPDIARGRRGFRREDLFCFFGVRYLNPRAAPQLCHGGRPARLGRERRRLVWGRMPWTRGPPCSDNSWQRGRRSVSPTDTQRRRAVSCPWPPCIVSHRPSAAAARLALRTHPPLCLLSPLPPHVQLAALAACRSPAWVPSPFLESLPMMFLTNSASLKYDVDT